MPRRNAPRQPLTILQKAQFGGVFWMKFELSLNKILRIFKSRLSVSAQPTKRLSKTEKFSLHFLIFSRALFSFKGKRKFLCFNILLTAEWRRRFPPQALLRRAGGAEGGSGGNSAPPFPASFSPPFLGVPTSLARHFQSLSYLKWAKLSKIMYQTPFF